MKLQSNRTIYLMIIFGWLNSVLILQQTMNETIKYFVKKKTFTSQEYMGNKNFKTFKQFKVSTHNQVFSVYIFLYIKEYIDIKYL